MTLKATRNCSVAIGPVELIGRLGSKAPASRSVSPVGRFAAIMFRVTASTIVLVCSAGLQGAPEAPIEGFWKNPIGTVIIAIAPCQKALCGTVKWASARAKIDAAKHTQQLIGSQILTNLRQTGAKWTGRLFIPDENIRVGARLQLVTPDRLKVTGCAIIGLICDSQIWSRVNAAGVFNLAPIAQPSFNLRARSRRR